ncbi:MAG: TrbC/VirB2 family protein [Clostridia bacterium]
MKKFMLRVMPIVLVALLIVGNTVFAADASSTVNNIMNNNQSIGSVNTMAKRIWGTVLTILQICAVAAIVFCGVKYMFASAENKAEIKNGMIGLVVGAILVFAASTVVQVIIKAAEDVSSGI